MKFKSLKESLFKSKKPLKIVEALTDGVVELYYDDIEIDCEYDASYDGSRSKYINTTTDVTLEVDRVDIEEVLAEILYDTGVADDSWSDQQLDQYLKDNFDDLIESNYQELLDRFRDEAEEQANDEFDPYDYEAGEEDAYWESQYDAWKNGDFD